MTRTPLAADIHSLSLDRTAPSALRERLAFAPADVPHVLAAAAVAAAPFRRLVLLSTCHRVELHWEAPGLGPSDARELALAWLARTKLVPRDELAPFAVSRRGEQAARHLLRVAAGLESAILGEAEILTQVRAAIRASIAAHAASPALKALFHEAVQTGERARREVWRTHPRADIGSAAADLMLAARARETPPCVLVLGAGQVAGLAMRALREHGAVVTVTNRTDACATELARRYGATMIPFGERDGALDPADAVIVATGAERHTLTAAEVARTLARRPRALAVIDTAMPRNADPAIGGVPGATLVDLEALHERTEQRQAARRAAIPAVEAIIESRVHALMARQARAPMPVRRQPMDQACT